MFNDDGSIAPGETVTVEMTLTLDSRVAAGTTLLNQARVVADDVASGGENGPSDLSDDGTDPDGVNSGSPGDTGTTDDPTPVVLPNSTLGVAKDSQWDDTLDTATFTFRIEHFGSSTALNLSLTEDLDAIFGAGHYSVGTPILLSGPGTVFVNSGFNGSGDQDLIGGGS